MEKKKLIHQVLICLVIALLAGCIGEILYNLPVFTGRKEKSQVIELKDAEVENFVLEAGLVQASENARITVNFKEQYVDKFIFDYSGNTESAMRCSFIVHTKDTEGKKAEKTIVENNNITAGRSVTNIRTKTNQIDIIFNEMQNLTISGIQLDNTGNFSIVRFGFVFIFVFWIVWAIIYKGNMAEKPEKIFLSMALMVGLLTVLALPGHKVGWDEEIHFRNAWGLSYLMEGKTEMFYPPSTELMSVASIHNWPYDLPSSEEEKKDELHFWNANGDRALQENDQFYTGRIHIRLNLVGYAAQALFIEAAKITRLPFSVLFLLGRLGNFLMYVCVCYFAIKHIPVGKRILAVIAMMPTPLFVSCVYTYDATLNSFVFLGIAYVLGEILSDEEYISYKNYAVFVVALVIASFTKMIYAPLLLLGMLIPNSKFKSKKEMLYAKGLLVVLVLGLIATFILPAENNTDARGGDTGVGRQLKVIFAHPVRYTQLLLTSIWERLLDFSIGTSAMSFMGHLGEGRYTQWIIAFIAATALTDKNENHIRLNKLQKSIAAMIIFAITCLIWTALYLSYTPVGADIIQGVQGRYFIPLVPLGLLLFDFEKIENKIERSKYNKVIMVTALSLTLLTYYGSFIKNCF